MKTALWKNRFPPMKAGRDMTVSVAFDLKPYLDEKRALVDESLKVYIEQTTPGAGGRISEAMAYSLMAGGKRLRPILCLAACEAVGGNCRLALPAAGALEMIHTYSLVHDDLPAMDNDDMRRGRPTCHKAFDEATAVLAGDALLTSAFHILSKADTRLSPEVQMEVLGVVSRASGAMGMIEGQMRDILAEGHPLTLDALKALHALKTGALIGASVESGAVVGGASQHERHALLTYAEKIGLAFQVVDDILNVEGDPLVMGKGVGTDEALNKATYPALMGLEPSRRYAQTLTDEAISALFPFAEQAAPLEALAKYVLTRKR